MFFQKRTWKKGISNIHSIINWKKKNAFYFLLVQIRTFKLPATRKLNSNNTYIRWTNDTNTQRSIYITRQVDLATSGRGKKFGKREMHFFHTILHTYLYTRIYTKVACINESSSKNSERTTNRYFNGASNICDEELKSMLCGQNQKQGKHEQQ